MLNETPQSNGPQQDELAWLAFQYFAGELAAADAEQFEARLAVDQQAREALAQAVDLFQAVAAVEADRTIVAEQAIVARAVHQRTKWSQQVAWTTAGVSAVAVLLMAGWNAGWFAGMLPLNQRAPAIVAVSPALASTWSEMQTENLADDEPADEDLALTEEELGLATDAPSWMTAAILGIAGHEPVAEPAPLDASESRPQEN